MLGTADPAPLGCPGTPPSPTATPPAPGHQAGPAKVRPRQRWEQGGGGLWATHVHVARCR